MTTTTKNEQLPCDLHNTVANASAVVGWLRSQDLSDSSREMYLDSLNEHLKVMSRLHKRLQKSI